MPQQERPMDILARSEASAIPTTWQKAYQMEDDCAKDIILPNDILCCSDRSAEEWLCYTRLPWWFYASFLNLCFRALIGRYDNKKSPSSVRQRLTRVLQKYPMDGDELIEEMKRYRRAWMQSGQINRCLVDMLNLENDPSPEMMLERAEEELYQAIFVTEEHETLNPPAAYFGSPELRSDMMFVFGFLPARLDPPPDDDKMAVSAIASPALSDDDIDRDESPHWTFKIEDSPELLPN